MKFHPVISVVLGVITTFIFLLFVGIILMYSIFDAGSGSSWFIPVLLFGFLFGGFVATNFAKEIKIRYSIYEGLIVGVIISIVAYFGTLPSARIEITQELFLILIFALLSGVGGYIAKSWGKPIQKAMTILKS